MHRAGFEPAPPKRVCLKSTTLDHSVNDALLIRDFVFPDSLQSFLVVHPSVQIVRKTIRKSFPYK